MGLSVPKINNYLLPGLILFVETDLRELSHKESKNYIVPEKLPIS